MLYIFGGHGYVGTGLRRCLNRQNVDFFSPTRVELDLSDLKSIYKWLKVTGASPGQGDSVIYLVSNPKRSDWTDNDIRRPSQHLQNLFSAFHDCHFIYSGSVDIYGTPQILPITESCPVSLESPYARSKYKAEETLSRHLPPSKYLVLRLPGIYGGLDPSSSVLNKFIVSLINLEPVKIRNVDVLGLQRDWIYRSDLAQAIVKMSREKACGVFNFVSGRSKPIDWWIRTLATESNLALNYEIEGSNKDDQRFDLIFDSDKLRTEFSWLEFSSLSINHFYEP